MLSCRTHCVNTVILHIQSLFNKHIELLEAKIWFFNSNFIFLLKDQKLFKFSLPGDAHVSDQVKRLLCIVYT